MSLLFVGFICFLFVVSFNIWKNNKSDDRPRDNQVDPSSLLQGCVLGPSSNIELPSQGGDAVQRLLQCNVDDPYEVLGVCMSATGDDIRKYYRKQCIMVHPDKNTMTGAEEAFKVLGRAFEHIGDPIKRAEFHQALTDQVQQEVFQKEFMDQQFQKMKQMFEERANTLDCNECGMKHPKYLTDRSLHSARYCFKHNRTHSVNKGDIWAESSHLGFRLNYFACINGLVYDVTEWAKCQDLRYIESNGHDIIYRLGRRRNHRHPSFESNDWWKNLLYQSQYPEQSPKTHNQSTNSNQRKSKRRNKKKKKAF